MPLEPNIYCAESGFDHDLALLVEVILLLDSQLQKIAEQGCDPDREDFSHLYERSEHIIGLGFVACQTYVHARSGWAARTKAEILDWGPQHQSGRSIVSIINAAANYWKHAPEAGLMSCPADTLGRTTLDALSAVGVEGSEFIVSQALDHLVGTVSSGRLMRLVPLLVEWRDAVTFNDSVFDVAK